MNSVDGQEHEDFKRESNEGRAIVGYTLHILTLFVGNCALEIIRVF